MVRPWAGLEVTTDKALYGIVGLLIDIDLGSRWWFTPVAGVGAYSEGNGKDLGHAIEFRTQVEFARRLRNDARIAIALSHISNASLGDENPGAEILSLYYSIPVGSTRHASPP